MEMKVSQKDMVYHCNKPEQYFSNFLFFEK